MKPFNLLLALLFMACMTISCGDDDDGGSSSVDCNSAVSVNSAIDDESQALADALSTYVMDQSPANCIALKDAYEAYVDALQSLQGCANQAGVGDEFAESIDDAQESINDLEC